MKASDSRSAAAADAAAASGPARAGDTGLQITHACGRRLILAGEIDETVIPALTAAISQAADGAGEIQIDLAGVDYCDLAGLRILIGLQGGDGHRAPRAVVLHSDEDPQAC